jgi:hypothetical protein
MKKIFNNIGLYVVLISSISIHGNIPLNVDPALYPELAKFINKFRCSTEVEENQAKHYLKSDELERIINAERMKRFVEENNLYHLRVADKCLCRRGNGLEVLSQKVKFREHDSQLTLSQTQQLALLAENTGFRDWNGNIGWDVNSKLTFFDTEDYAFYLGRIKGNQEKNIPDQCKLVFFANIPFYNHMEPDAQVWFKERLNTLLNSEEGTIEASILPFNEQYDDSSINFEKVKVEYRAYRKEHHDY